MTNTQTSHRLRVYHFGATLLAVGILLWAVYLVRTVMATTQVNYEQTQCNQGLLLLAAHGEWVERQMIQCSDEVYNTLREKY